MLNGWNLMPAKVLELVLLLGGATLLTGLTGGRRAVGRLYAGLTRWRIGLGAVVIVVVALLMALTEIPH